LNDNIELEKPIKTFNKNQKLKPKNNEKKI
jgi:hypothetical protein